MSHERVAKRRKLSIILVIFSRFITHFTVSILGPETISGQMWPIRLGINLDSSKQF